MPAVTFGRLCLGLVAALIALPAGAVGLGPLTKKGETRSDRKGFYLTLMNPYPRSERFRLYGVGWNDEEVAPRVLIPVARPMLGRNSNRKVLVVATDLRPGEEYRFRVCAELAEPKEGIIHARVCSKLVARRLG